MPFCSTGTVVSTVPVLQFWFWAAGFGSPNLSTVGDVKRPTKFAHFRYVGDKRNLVVYDVDQLQDEPIISELMAAGTYLCFGPDTLAEARNRGFTPYKGNGAG